MRRLVRDIRAEPALDDVERHVDARRDTCRRDHAVIDDARTALTLMAGLSAARASEKITMPKNPAPATSFREATVPPRFKVGDPVLTKVDHRPGHTRLPRYARGRRGVIAAQRGVNVFPDTNAHGLGEHPQHLYSVRFTAIELWGAAATPNRVVYLDLWGSYLQPA